MGFLRCLKRQREARACTLAIAQILGVLALAKDRIEVDSLARGADRRPVFDQTVQRGDYLLRWSRPVVVRRAAEVFFVLLDGLRVELLGQAQVNGELFIAAVLLAPDGHLKLGLIQFLQRVRLVSPIVPDETLVLVGLLLHVLVEEVEEGKCFVDIRSDRRIEFDRRELI